MNVLVKKNRDVIIEFRSEINNTVRLAIGDKLLLPFSRKMIDDGVWRNKYLDVKE